MSASYSVALSFICVTLISGIGSTAEPVIEPSSYQAPAPASNATQTVRFNQQQAEVGDRVTQQVSLDFELQSTILQSGQIANQSTTSVRRRQQRLIEALEVTQGQVRRAKVSFPHSRVVSPENPDPQTEVSQPVEGKSYLVTRNGQQLFITDLEGLIPRATNTILSPTVYVRLGFLIPWQSFLRLARSESERPSISPPKSPIGCLA